jgi:DNA-binding PadR family transcriptional regulator
MRLADRSLLETAWETVEAGRPPRHMYKLTADGLRYARTQVAAEDVQVLNAQPVLSRVKA